MKRKTKPSVYVMNSEQDNHWVQAFVNAKDRGDTDLEADAAAYKAVVKKWPEVKKFDKLSAKVRAEGTR